MKRQQTGFTLIELIIVIVILGILAVTAAPRFIDIQSDARAASLEGVAAALQGGSQLVFAKAAISGVQGASTSTVDLDNDNTDDVSVAFGYPDPALTTEIGSTTALSQFASWVDLDVAASGGTADFDFLVTDSTITITQNGTAATVACRVDYVAASTTNPSPTITVTSTNC